MKITASRQGRQWCSRCRTRKRSELAMSAMKLMFQPIREECQLLKKHQISPTHHLLFENLLTQNIYHIQNSIIMLLLNNFVLFGKFK